MFQDFAKFFFHWTGSCVIRTAKNDSMCSKLQFSVNIFVVKHLISFAVWVANIIANVSANFSPIWHCVNTFFSVTCHHEKCILM